VTIPTSFLSFELLWYAVGLGLTIAAFRQGRFLGMCVLAAVAFSIAAEYFDIRGSDSYYYARFLLMIGPSPDWVPLVIGVAWAGIVYGTLRTTERYGLRWYERPLAMAALAVSLDLFLDPIAATSRIVDAPNILCNTSQFPPGDAQGLGMWVWCVNPEESALWFGVPVANFFGWLGMVSSFAFTLELARGPMRAEERRWWVQLLLVAFVAGVGLLLMIGIILIYAKVVVGLHIPVWLAVAALGVPGLLNLMRSGGKTGGNEAPDWVALSPLLLNLVFATSALVFAGVGDRLGLGGVGKLALCAAASATLYLWPYRGALTGQPPDRVDVDA